MTNHAISFFDTFGLLDTVRKYLSILMLALIILPVAEKAHHEWGHFAEDNCGFEGLHYCQTEHHCETCDFVFATNVNPPAAQELEIGFVCVFHERPAATVSGVAEREDPGFFLRGPPHTA